MPFFMGLWKKIKSAGQPSEIHFVKKELFVFLVLAISTLPLLYCEGGGKRRASSPGATPPSTYPSGTTLPTAPAFVWGGWFEVTDSGRYETLLELCSRCGTLQITPYSIKGALVIGDSPLKCDSWLQKGYLQIEFAANKLPTDVAVIFQPEYSSYGAWGGRQQRCFGHPFAVRGRAIAVNNSEGFSITLTPANGLGGPENLYIVSQNSHHVSQHTLEVDINYGGEGDWARRSQILSAILQKQGTKPISSVQFTCRQYPPHFIQSCSQ